MDDNQEEFYYNDLVNEALFNILPDVKYDKIIEITNLVNSFNYLPRLEIEFDLNQLDSDLEDIVLENENDSNDAIGDLLLDTITSTFLDYLETLGVIVTADIKLSELEDIFRCLLTLYTLDIDSKNDLISVLSNKDKDDVEIFIDIMEDYSNLSTSRLLTIVEDVNNDFLSSLEDYYQVDVSLNNPNIEEDTKEQLEYLIKSNPMFINTQVIKDVIDGKVYNNLTEVKNVIYSALERLQDNTNLIPYEILAGLYITNTEKEDLNTLYKEEIDLSLVSWIKEEQAKHTLIDSLVSSAISDLTFRR